MNFPTLLSFFQGFGVSAALIIAIGAQNAFVIKQGLRREHRFSVALISSILDALLIIFGVTGFGALVQTNSILLTLVTWVGICYLFVFGLFSFRSAFRTKRLEVAAGGRPISFKKILLMSISFSLLNPHCYIDTVVLIGSVSANFEGASKIAFTAGAIAASFTWFFTIIYASSLLTPIFKRPAAWRILDTSIGLIMWGIAAKLFLGR